MKKEKTVLSKIAVAIVVIYYLLGIAALVAQNIGSGLKVQENRELFHFLYHKVWDNLAPILVLVPLIGAIPNLVLNLVGMIRERRVFPFLLCIVLPIPMWILVAATATAYF